jgi:hypothetical protein
MAARKMTFSIPEELADAVVRGVPARERSRFVADALAERMGKRRRELIRACELANSDADVAAIETDFDRLSDEISEPWVDAPSR